MQSTYCPSMSSSERCWTRACLMTTVSCTRRCQSCSGSVQTLPPLSCWRTGTRAEPRISNPAPDRYEHPQVLAVTLIFGWSKKSAYFTALSLLLLWLAVPAWCAFLTLHKHLSPPYCWKNWVQHLRYLPDENICGFVALFLTIAHFPPVFGSVWHFFPLTLCDNTFFKLLFKCITSFLFESSNCGLKLRKALFRQLAAMATREVFLNNIYHLHRIMEFFVALALTLQLVYSSLVNDKKKKISTNWRKFLS